MAEIVLRGLTWGHRRAIDPLVASVAGFEAAHPGIRVVWRARTLHEFEHQPFAEATRSVDLIVFDHPFCGTIAAEGLLRPLDRVLSGVPGADAPARYIGPSLTSYRYAGSTWAAPVDGATIHAVYRPDLLARLDAEVPRHWSDVIALAERARRHGLRVVLSGHGHHALLTLASLAANLGTPWDAGGDLDRRALDEALGLLEHALAISDRATSLSVNAIGLHDLLAQADDAVYCPAAYGYATYGEPHDGHRLAFGPFPGPHGCGGTAVGGAGVGVTVTGGHPEAAERYVAHLLRPEVQQAFAASSGQPACVEAWTDPDVDSRFNGFFSATRETMERSWIRPRFTGYGRLEQALAEALQAHLHGLTSRSEASAALADLWNRNALPLP